MNFRGTYEHSLDDRGRVAVPARYREAFARGAVLAKSPDGCVELYTQEDYDKKIESLRSRPDTQLRNRRLRRMFSGGAWDAEIDRQGRVLLPPPLRAWAGLKGSVSIVGCIECLEIWDSERAQQEMAKVEVEYPRDLESLDDGGR